MNKRLLRSHIVAYGLAVSSLSFVLALLFIVKKAVVVAQLSLIPTCRFALAIRIQGVSLDEVPEIVWKAISVPGLMSGRNE